MMQRLRNSAWLAVLILAVSCADRPAPPPALALPLDPASSGRQVGDFTLTAPDGSAFRFLDKAPKLTLVTFLYTHCTDVCPFIALKGAEALDLLGPRASQVRLVAVTTDPERDTPALAGDYVRSLGLEGRLVYLTGTRASVEPVWRAFGVEVTRSDPEEAAETTKNAQELGLALPEKTPKVSVTGGLSQRSRDLGEKAATRFGGGYEVAHSAPYWLVDAGGKVVAVFGDDATVQALADDLAKRL